MLSESHMFVCDYAYIDTYTCLTRIAVKDPAFLPPAHRRSAGVWSETSLCFINRTGDKLGCESTAAFAASRLGCGKGRRQTDQGAYFCPSGGGQVMRAWSIAGTDFVLCPSMKKEEHLMTVTKQREFVCVLFVRYSSPHTLTRTCVR